jgi:hypothetical protein
MCRRPARVDQGKNYSGASWLAFRLPSADHDSRKKRLTGWLHRAAFWPPSETGATAINDSMASVVVTSRNLFLWLARGKQAVPVTDCKWTSVLFLR